MSNPARSGVEGPTPSALPEREVNMTRTYVRVVILEAVIVALLWLLGRLFG